MKNYYDIIIIWAGAAGLYTAIESPEYYTKLILEKNKNPWVKVLLSGWERANVSNVDIEPERDYFGQNTKSLISMFKKYNNYDMISFFAENWVNIVEEDRGRLILESWDSKELLALLVKLATKNNSHILCDHWVVDINKPEKALTPNSWEKPLTPNPSPKERGENDYFEVICANWEKFYASKVVLTTGGKSFSQVGTTWDGYVWAEKFGHTLNKPHRGLCGLVTKKDLSEISGVSLDVQIEMFDKNNLKKAFYTEYGPMLFTHFGISGPIIFNAAVALGEHINSLKLDDFISTLDLSKVPENEIPDYIDRSYILQNIFLKVTFTLEKSPKRVVTFFDLENEEHLEQILELQDYRTWKEAKVTGGGVNIDELDKNLQSKLVPWLYFAGEILDITGKTWGFNLQLSWTTGYVVGKSLE